MNDVVGGNYDDDDDDVDVEVNVDVGDDVQ